MSALHERSALSQLASGERLLGYGSVVPANSAKGVSINVGGVVANQLMHNVGAQSGGAGSIAAGMPGTSGALLLRVTDQRVGLVRSLDGTPVWEVPRAWVARVERRPRTRLMARFRLHYADGSWLAFLTMRRRTIEQFRSLIG
ncbi:hypothetical protein [Streptomyces camelliae]|uniref:Uncharacterized protein n=1 Tax=Streptomyces camelliae TaxID=3004093 RepID=A0ABY7PJ82_9ACTN|nr:hypothetical protein [Streptomyces sp. HUAS 2-6]WBO68553.1 hypothetical protein O1G22_39945 [Streptomyces sp. HUAS 2-6]